MKRLIAASLVCLVSLFGCEDKREIPNPPLTKGWVCEKRFIPSQNLQIQLAAATTDKCFHYITAQSPEMYVIVIYVSEELPASNRKLHKFGFYQVSPILFSETQLGAEIDVTTNDGFKPILISQ